MTIFATSVCAALCVLWMLSDASCEDMIYFGRKVVFHSENGSYVDGVLRHNVESDIASCIYECKMRPGCGYLNYHRQSLQCYLMRILLKSETMAIEFSPGYVHGNKLDWKLNIPCNGCWMFETCGVTAGSSQCTIKECGIPPEFPNSVVMGNMHTIGARNAYACTQYNEMTIYTTHISECLDSGIWSDTQFVCSDISECATDPCLNGGTCIDGINEYTCTCVSGYTGGNCQIDINECVSNPCQQGGTCIDAVNGYTCDCTSGYAGENCQTAIQCDNGWSVYGLSCYKLFNDLKNFDDAKYECEHHGAHLADVNSMPEMDFLKGIYLDAHYTSAVDGVWVSSNDRQTESIWKLSDNSEATFLNWHINQPDNQFDYDDCIQVWPNLNFEWNDVDCNFTFWFFCEIEQSPN